MGEDKNEGSTTQSVNKVNSGSANDYTCIICSENLRAILFYPCNPVVTCEGCSLKFKNGNCPMDRRKIERLDKVYF